MAPTSKVLARSQTDLEKSGANSTIRGNSSAGNVGIRKTPFGEEIFRSLCGLPSLFQRPGMDKVQLIFMSPEQGLTLPQMFVTYGELYAIMLFTKQIL